MTRIGQRSRSSRRQGTALTEFAVVAAIFLMFLFGVVEYARLIFTRQLLFNAAREGARYAVVNAGDTTMVADTQAATLTKLAGLNSLVSNYSCTVFAADSTGKNIGPATSAQFGQLICVQIDCDYTPILPTLLMMSKSIHLTSKSLMYSEAN